jgi:hypothetical protein
MNCEYIRRAPGGISRCTVLVCGATIHNVKICRAVYNLAYFPFVRKEIKLILYDFHAVFVTFELLNQWTQPN